MLIPVGIGLATEVSLWFLFIWAPWLILLVIGFIWLANTFTIEGREYRRDILPIEQAYSKLAAHRKKQYRKLIKEAYRNAQEDKSNRDILSLFQEVAELDGTNHGDFVKDELATIRRTKAELKKWEQDFES